MQNEITLARVVKGGLWGAGVYMESNLNKSVIVEIQEEIQCGQIQQGQMR